MNSEWCIVCLDTGDAFNVHEFPLNVGRSEDNDIVINSPYVSRHQFMLRETEDGGLEFVNKASHDNLAVINGATVSTSAPLSADRDEVHIVNIGLTNIGIGPDFQTVKTVLEEIGKATEESYFVKIGDKVFGPLSKREFTEYCAKGFVKPNCIFWTASNPKKYRTATDFYEEFKSQNYDKAERTSALGNKKNERWKKLLFGTILVMVCTIIGCHYLNKQMDEYMKWQTAARLAELQDGFMSGEASTSINKEEYDRCSKEFHYLFDLLESKWFDGDNSAAHDFIRKARSKIRAERRLEESRREYFE